MAQAYVRLIRVGKNRFDDIGGKGQRLLKGVVRRNAILIAADIRASMRARKSGRIYYYNGRRIQASAPGEPPAIRSGRLYANIKPIFQADGSQATIDPRAKGVKYAAYLEKGTSRMLPRPYLSPAFARRREAFLNEVQEVIAKLIEQG